MPQKWLILHKYEQASSNERRHSLPDKKVNNSEILYETHTSLIVFVKNLWINQSEIGNLESLCNL